MQKPLSALPPKADITCPFRKRHPQIWTTPGSNSLFSRTNSLFLRELLIVSEFARVSAFKNRTKQDFDHGIDQT